MWSSFNTVLLIILWFVSLNIKTKIMSLLIIHSVRCLQFLVFDTQMVVGGKHRRYQLSPEEYIYGALQLYVDIVNLFILLLGLVGKRN